MGHGVAMISAPTPSLQAEPQGGRSRIELTTRRVVRSPLVRRDHRTGNLEINWTRAVQTPEASTSVIVFDRRQVIHGTPFLNLAANTLADLGNKVPEKWEGLAIGPKLSDGSHLLLAGTDNDYSVTQNGSGTQFDVYFKFSDPDPCAQSIQCPINTTANCFLTTGGGAVILPTDYELLPGVLHAYTVPASDLASYVPPGTEP